MRIFKYIGLLVIVTLFFSSCQKWINPDINNNPSVPTTTTVDLLLPGIEANIAYEAGGDMVRAASVWTQQLAGASNQTLDEDQYIYTESDVDNGWRWMYSQFMEDTRIMISQANANGSPWYAGIGQVLMAYQLGIMTDLFGDIPYSQAFEGSANLQPVFDPQQKIYADIVSLLDSAVVNLNASTSNHQPSSASDLMYGGNLTQWIQAAYSLQARYAIHLSKVSTSAYQNALTALSMGAINSNANDLQFAFGGAATNNNPVYQFLNQRGGYIVVGALILDSMNNDADPRISQYAVPVTPNVYFGSAAGSGNAGASQIGPFYGSPTSIVPFITYAETQFIAAEAYFQTGNLAQAALAYDSAVAASFNKFSVVDPSYVQQITSETASTITYNKIMFQKYLALYMQLEVFNDWRRSGIPAISPSVNNVTNNVIPRRYPYPISERLENKNYIPGITITDRVWWDAATPVKSAKK